jgi:hypothetical protein
LRKDFWPLCRLTASHQRLPQPWGSVVHTDEGGLEGAKAVQIHAARADLRYNARIEDIRASEMKTLTDDPDWACDIYEARALAMMFVRKHGCALQSSPCLQAVSNGLTVTFYPNRSPVLLTIDAPPGARVLSLEWNDGDAWRVAIETYHSGRWESRLKALVHPRPWLERWRALATLTGS